MLSGLGISNLWLIGPGENLAHQFLVFQDSEATGIKAVYRFAAGYGFGDRHALCDLGIKDRALKTFKASPDLPGETSMGDLAVNEESRFERRAEYAHVFDEGHDGIASPEVQTGGLYGDDYQSDTINAGPCYRPAGPARRTVDDHVIVRRTSE